MLRITVEKLPLGDATHYEHLATMIIANDGTGTKERGNYEVRFVGEGMSLQPSHVLGFPRLRLGAWDLVYRALDVVFRDRNVP